jgi:hypothetical protein
MKYFLFGFLFFASLQGRALVQLDDAVSHVCAICGISLTYNEVLITQSLEKKDCYHKSFYLCQKCRKNFIAHSPQGAITALNKKPFGRVNNLSSLNQNTTLIGYEESDNVSLEDDTQMLLRNSRRTRRVNSFRFHPRRWWNSFIGFFSFLYGRSTPPIVLEERFERRTLGAHKGDKYLFIQSPSGVVKRYQLPGNIIELTRFKDEGVLILTDKKILFYTSAEGIQPYSSEDNYDKAARLRVESLDPENHTDQDHTQFFVQHHIYEELSEKEASLIASIDKLGIYEEPFQGNGIMDERSPLIPPRPSMGRDYYTVSHPDGTCESII